MRVGSHSNVTFVATAVPIRVLWISMLQQFMTERRLLNVWSVTTHVLESTSLNQHAGAVHEGKKPFKCEICDYSCSIKNYLNEHAERVHEGKKSFKCQICDYKSSQKGDLKRHVAVHEEKKAFECKFCAYSSPNKSHFIQHVTCHEA